MKKSILQLLQWFLAIGVAVLIFNTLLFGYHRPTGWIDRSNGATNAIWQPNSFIVHGTEGYGIHQVDKDGYLNDAFPSEPNYVICVGASHTQAKEMSREKRYSSRLNLLLGGTATDPNVYNVSQDGYFLPNIIKNFPSIVAEFPDAGTIIIEIGDINFSAEELIEAMNQSTYNPNSKADYLLEHMSFKQRIKNSIKMSVPLLSLSKKQFEAMSIAETEAQTTLDAKAYVISLQDALSLIRDQFEGEIIIVYHPTVNIQSDGTISILRNELEIAFEKVCVENRISFINMHDRFLSAYQEDYAVPYGFHNTTLGTGHLNAVGHMLIAEELFAVMEGGALE